MNPLFKADSNKGFSVYNILIYLVIFAISGYLSYRFILSSHLDELKKVRLQYNEERTKLVSEAEKARELAKINFSVQRLERELYEINNHLFAENEVLSFMRMLPDITKQTENNLMSIVPSEIKVIQTQASKEPNATNTPSYKLKPIEIVIIGDYTDIIKFFEQIESLNKYVTINSINMSSSGDDNRKINVKMELNLVQMDIDRDLLNRLQSLQLVKQTQPVKTNNLLNNQQDTVSNVNVPPNLNTQLTNQPEKKIVSSPSLIKPVQEVRHAVQIAKTTETQKKPVQTINTPNTTKQDQPVQKHEGPVKNTNTKPLPNTKQLIKQKERYTVQVGIFISQDNANNLVNMFKSHNYEPWIRHGFVSSKPAYYVYVGNFDTESSARSLGRDMRSKLPFVKYYYIVKNIYQIEGNNEKIKESIIIE